MYKTLLLFISIFLFAPALCRMETLDAVNANKSITVGNDFPAFEEIPKDVLLPPNYSWKIQGRNYIVKGKPRFLIGAEMGAAAYAGIEGKPSPGYADQYKWIYEKMPEYEEAQRLGFDTMGYFVPIDWIRKYDPDIPLIPGGMEHVKRMNEWVKKIKLPLYVDFTMFPFAGGKLAGTDKIPEHAKTDPGIKQHWLPYNLDHPDGMKLYQEYWRRGAKELVEANVYPLYYELFNEPSYFSETDENRKRFSKWLKARYGTVEKMNETWRAGYASFKAASQFKLKVENAGLYVDYTKFLEDRWVKIQQVGIDTIKSVDKREGIQVTAQPLGWSALKPHLTSFNYYKLSKVFNTLAVPTGQGGLLGAQDSGLNKPADETIKSVIANRPAVNSGLTMAILRSLGDKILVNGESGFPPYDRKDMRNRFWLEMMRGVNACYLFEWTRLAWKIEDEVKAGRDPVEASKDIARTWPYMILNPYTAPTHAFLGIMDFKKEMLLVQDIVVRRPQNVSSDIAFLYSYGSQRYDAVSRKATMVNEMFNYYASLVNSPYTVDVILEEQIRDEDRQNNYKVIVTGGVNFVPVGVQKKLEDFVKRGGILITGIELLTHDDYGNALTDTTWAGVKVKKMKAEPLKLTLDIPQTKLLPGEIRGISCNTIILGKGAKPVAMSGDDVVASEYSLGKGKIYYIGAILRDYYLTSLLTSILERENISKPVSIVQEDNTLVPNVEKVIMDRGKIKGVYLYNFDKYTKLATIKLDKSFAPKGPTYVQDPLEGYAYANNKGRIKWNSDDLIEDGVSVILKQQDRKLIIFTPRKWEKSKLRKIRKSAVVARYEKEIAEQVESARLAASREVREKKEAPGFDVDPDNCFTIDLRKFSNRGFKDEVAGDGKGGWTDQGRDNSLDDIQPGIHVWRNVPFDIIRWDQNEGRTCIVLSSLSMKGGLEKVKGIPVKRQAKRLYFLQTAAWVIEAGAKPAIKYVINYSDGSKIEYIARTNRKKPKEAALNDWWGAEDLNERTLLGWKNSRDRGLYINEWDNPMPGKIIESIDIYSFANEVVPIIIGISGENYRE